METSLRTGGGGSSIMCQIGMEHKGRGKHRYRCRQSLGLTKRPTGGRQTRSHSGGEEMAMVVGEVGGVVAIEEGRRRPPRRNPEERRGPNGTFSNRQVAARNRRRDAKGRFLPESGPAADANLAAKDSTE